MAGIDSLVADVVNRFIDYGGHCGLEESPEDNYYHMEDSNILRQLKYFYKKDIEKKFSNHNEYVKAYYLHHLLDFFRETRVDIQDLNLVFKEFILKKVVSTLKINNGNSISFKKEIDEIFSLLKKFKTELHEDLKSNYLQEK